jgi:hypothetical protein
MVRVIILNKFRILSARICHAELYNGFLDQIYNETKVRPRQYEFARLNLNIP